MQNCTAGTLLLSLMNFPEWDVTLFDDSGCKNQILMISFDQNKSLAVESLTLKPRW